MCFEVLPLPPVAQFAELHHVEIKGLLSAEICRLVYDYVCLRRDTGTMLSPDQRVEGAGRLYCDMLTETLLAQKQPAIEQVVGAALWPSYSYVRLHHHGAVLAPHRDREASEIAVTIAIGGDRDWPIAFKTGRGDVSFALEPGDAVVYDGRKLSHWRDPFEGRDPDSGHAVLRAAGWRARVGPLRRPAASAIRGYRRPAAAPARGRETQAPAGDDLRGHFRDDVKTKMTSEVTSDDRQPGVPEVAARIDMESAPSQLSMMLA